MTHPLKNKLASLRSRLRLLVLVHGLSAVVSIVLGAAIILGFADYLLRYQDRGVRIFSSFALLGAVGWAYYRYFYLPAAVRFRDVDLAMKLQQRFPNLEDRLVNTVEFISQDENDLTAGSPALRRSVIAQTTAEIEDVDFKQAVDPRPVIRAVLVGVAVCAAAGLLAVLDPAASHTAVVRLINPLNNTNWPQKNYLSIRKNVDRVGRGQEFEIEVVDSRGAALPREVYVHYQFANPDGGLTEESVLMPQVGKIAVARRENVVRPFSYRVEGGDDHSMPWMPVEVLDQPAIESMQIRMFPPSYTGWPPDNAENDLRALVGTRLEIEAKATKPLKSAMLCLDNESEISGRVSNDGRLIIFNNPEMVVKKSGSYWFRLMDRDGLSGGENDRWELIAVPDTPPSVTIEQPTGNLHVTPQAVVPLRIMAKDDLAIRDVTMAFSRQTSNETAPSAETDVPLFAGPNKIERLESGGVSQATASGQLQTVEYSWQLEPLRLTPGMQISYQAIASDYLPQTARSEPRKLIVVTPAELQDRIAGRNNLLLSEIDRVLKMQRAGLSQVGAIGIRLEEIKRLQQPELDQLRAAELGQRQVSAVLTNRGDGVPSHVLAMLADLENNRIENPDLKERLELVLEEIKRLDRENLPDINKDLTSAVKSAEVAMSDTTAPTKADPRIAAALASAEKNQGQVIESLEKLLKQFTQWDSNRRFQRDLSQLLREQEETAQKTAEVGRRTLSKELKDLLPQDTADLRILTSRQFDHARSLDKILQEMQRADAELQKSDPLGAKIVAIALDEAARMGIGGQMRSCGDNLRQNQIGQAAELQRTIIDDLQQILDMLIHQSSRESAADQLARLENIIKDLQKRQQTILDGTRKMEQTRVAQGQFNRAQLATILDIGRMQRSLQIETSHIGRQLGNAAAFSLAFDRAGSDMDEAAGLLDRHQTGAETQQAQQNALRRFDLLLEALKPEPPSEQQNAAANTNNKTPPNANQAQKQQQSLATLAELKLLKMLQEEINHRTAALAEAVGPDGQPTEQQQKEYEQIAKEQARLAELIMKMMKGK